MTKNKNNSLQNRTEGFHTDTGKYGNKKKPKDKDVSRFINEGNPNTQAGDKDPS